MEQFTTIDKMSESEETDNVLLDKAATDGAENGDEQDEESHHLDNAGGSILQNKINEEKIQACYSATYGSGDIDGSVDIPVNASHLNVGWESNECNKSDGLSSGTIAAAFLSFGVYLGLFLSVSMMIISSMYCILTVHRGNDHESFVIKDLSKYITSFATDT